MASGDLSQLAVEESSLDFLLSRQPFSLKPFGGEGGECSVLVNVAPNEALHGTSTCLSVPCDAS